MVEKKKEASSPSKKPFLSSFLNVFKSKALESIPEVNKTEADQTKLKLKKEKSE